MLWPAVGDTAGEVRDVPEGGGSEELQHTRQLPEGGLRPLQGEKMTEIFASRKNPQENSM
jgi:hypothetical protein